MVAVAADMKRSGAEQEHKLTHSGVHSVTFARRACLSGSSGVSGFVFSITCGLAGGRVMVMMMMQASWRMLVRA
jgi:hypothetical protein